MKKMLLLIVKSLIACMVVLGIFFIMSVIIAWGEKHLILFSIIAGVIIIKLLINEL